MTVISGQGYICLARSSLGETAHKTISANSDQSSEIRALDHGPRSPDASQIVDTDSGGRRGTTDICNSSVHDHGCLSIRLGCNTRSQIGK